MTLSVNSNISALNALSTKQSITANNIANSETRDFKGSTTILAEDSNGSVSVITQPVNTPGTMIQQPDGTLEETSNIDLAREMTDMITTRHAYEANLKALNINTEMEDAVLDIIG